VSTHPPALDQRGFTLVEVMVAIFVLLVGVLGVVSMVDGANAVTSKTRAREGGTNIARSVIEISRSVRYRDLTATALLDELDSRDGLEDVEPGPDYAIHARGLDYAATITVCSLDDPQDGLGNHNGPVAYCADSDVLAAGANAADRNPDDYKRVRVTLRWTTRSTGQSITQTSSIINPVGGLGPSVTGLVMQTPPSVTADPLLIEDPNAFSAHFIATTSTSAAQVTWSVSGRAKGQADGGPKTWSFDWDITDPSTHDPIYYDCTYVIQADAFDSQGRSGAPYAKTVRLNRMLPLKPEGFAGGRNGNGNFVDLAWVTNPECDVVGYRVYSGDSPTTITNPVTCLGAATPTLDAKADECIHNAPAGNVWYRLVALDTPSAGGTPREGADSDVLAIGPVSGNNVPSVPTGLSSCIGGQAGCLVANGVSADEGVLVIRWLPSVDTDGTIQLYRIYRDGVAYANRHASFYPKTGELLAWIEPEPDSSSHTYRISAVDDDFGESALSDPPLTATSP
jgi:prepilin-type N-terminal cleavage/methylation domain-containing protein